MKKVFVLERQGDHENWLIGVFASLDLAVAGAKSGYGDSYCGIHITWRDVERSGSDEWWLTCDGDGLDPYSKPGFNIYEKQVVESV